MQHCKIIAILFSLTIAGIISLTIEAQTPPQAISYQTVIRDSTGDIVDNQSVAIKILIRQGAANGTVVYSESHSPTSNDFGLVNLEIGNGAADSTAFNSINWSNGPYYTEVLLDETGGSSFTSMGTQQMLSVPYALYSETAGSAALPDNDWTVNGNNMSSTVSGNVGIGNAIPTAKLDVNGMIRSTGVNVPQTGVGIELLYATGRSLVQSYDRDSSNWKPLFLRGSEVWLGSDGTSEPNVVLKRRPNGATSPLFKLQAHDCDIKLSGVPGIGQQVHMRFIDENDYIYFRDQTTPASDEEFGIVMNDTKVFSILANNYVGIGTAAPLCRLDVAGDLRVRDISSDPTLTEVLVKNDSGKIFCRDINTLSDGDWTLNGNDIYSTGSGNVGIGNANPTAKLDVNGMIRSTGYNIPASGAGLEMLLANEINYIQGYDRDSSEWMPVYVRGSEVRLGGGGTTTPHVLLNDSGNLGIGTTTPIHQLQVVEDISAQQKGKVIASFHNSGNVGVGIGYYAPDSVNATAGYVRVDNGSHLVLGTDTK